MHWIVDAALDALIGHGHLEQLQRCSLDEITLAIIGVQPKLAKIGTLADVRLAIGGWILRNKINRPVCLREHARKSA
jgi:hypothetical protein